MNCLKLHLDVPCVTILSDTLPPIPAPFLFNKPYDVRKPSWCATPNISLHFEEIGTIKSLEIGHEPFQIIGRNDRCHIILNDVMVSRCHAILFHTSSGESYLLDVNSSHGTFLGNIRLVPFVPTLIKKSSVLKFGSSEAQFIIREYPNVDDVLKKSNGCQSIEEKEVVLNTFHNLTCLSSCTSAIPKSLSLSKLFSRTPTADSSRSYHEQIPQFENRTSSYDTETDLFRNSPASSDDLMSICTSGESSDNSPDLDSISQSSFISPKSSVPQHHFLSLAIPVDLNPHPPQSSPHNQLVDIEITSISSSPTSSHSDAFEKPDSQLMKPGQTEEESIQLRKCLRRSYSVDSNIRAIPQNCFYISPTNSTELSNSMNFGRRTCSVDFTTVAKRNTNAMICSRKRVRFSLSEFDLAKHQERITVAESNTF